VLASPRRTIRVLSKAFIGGAVLFLVLAAAAHAGRYHAYSCRTPAGEAAPADGWSGSVATGSAPDVYAKNTCGEGGALVATLGDYGHFANADLATWAFAAPSGDTISSAVLWRAGDTDGGSVLNAFYEFWLAGETKVFEECLASLKCPGLGDPTQPLASVNRVTVPSEQLGTHLSVNASCGGGPGTECQAGLADPYGYAAVVYLYAADVTLEQNAGPSASNVSGELASAPSVQGPSDIVFSATDPGSGVYQAVFSVDGQVVQSTLVNENGGRCKNVGQTTDGLPAFLYLQPCLKSVTADVGFDSTKVSNGVHHLIVSVSDAAGNTATVLDRSIVVQNELGTCNAECDGHAILHSAGSDARLLRRTIARRYANSGFTLAGELVDHAGSPMNGAVIELRQRASYPGARNVLVATTTTGSKGGWKLRVPKGPSRLLTVGYRSRSNNPNFATQLQYRETVAAGVRLSAPRRARPGRAFAFRGGLAGGYIPPGGALVSLEIFFGGEWREIALLRTNRRGAFAYRYTFAAIGPATYRFRAQLPHTIGYPFASGASRSSYIHVAG